MHIFKECFTYLKLSELIKYSAGSAAKATGNHQLDINGNRNKMV